MNQTPPGSRSPCATSPRIATVLEIVSSQRNVAARSRAFRPSFVRSSESMRNSQNGRSHPRAVGRSEDTALAFLDQLGVASYPGGNHWKLREHRFEKSVGRSSHMSRRERKHHSPEPSGSSQPQAKCSILITDGGFLKDGAFRHMLHWDTDKLEELFRTEVFRL